MERIGVLGGSFNPVHIEHINIAVNAIEELGLSKLIIMPAFVPPHKSSALAPSDDRLNMLKIAFSGIENIEISDYEIKKGGTSYTYSTLEYLKKEYDKNLLFIMGEDLLDGFPNWKNPERITELADVAVFGRDNYTADFDRQCEFFKKNYGKEFVRLKYNGKKASSTKIRVFSALSLPLDGLTPKGVENYIYDKNLYKKEEFSVYIDFVRSVLPEKRLIHTASVIECALRKADELKLNKDKVFLAGLLHDLAKYTDYASFKGFSKPEDMPEPVVHSFLGAYIAEKVLGVKDSEILDAIKYHTSGKPKMTTLGKLIFVADMLEDGRTYDGVDKLREYYEKHDFDACFKECLKEETLHLKNKNQPIYRLTLDAYEYYVNGQGE